MIELQAWMQRAALFAGAALMMSSTAAAGEVRFNGEGHAQNPVWSLDGKYVAFEVNRFAGSIDLFFAKMGGDVAGDASKVSLPGGGSAFGPSNQVVINPSWHPQGIAVFEGSNQGGEYRLYYAKPDGAAAAEMLTNALAPGGLAFPTISPDGNMLAFISSQSGNGDIRAWNRATNQVAQLTSTDSTEVFPQYNADGKRILFTRKKDHSEDIFEIAADGSERAVAGGDGDQTRPTYGAGDRVVYFNSGANDTWDLAEMDGTSRTVLARGVRLPQRARPALSPDGQWVAYTYDDPTKNTYIELKRLDGTKTVKVTTQFTVCGEPAIGVQGGRVLLAYTALPSSGSDWRFLYVEDITSKLQ